jgi:hypothetical protein
MLRKKQLRKKGIKFSYILILVSDEVKIVQKSFINNGLVALYFVIIVL